MEQSAPASPVAASPVAISPIGFSNAISIRGPGRDEGWLQAIIAENPACLGLGNLELISKERRQSPGGRLDLLLINRDANKMYEVEIMLEETDETHIVRTIEYWDNERRRWPQRQHFAVLVAESFNRRYFNVIQLLSHSIPIIAVQVNLLETGGQRGLHFSKVLDTYEEPDDGESSEDNWKKQAPWTIDNARALVEVVGSNIKSPTINFRQDYIAIAVGGKNYFYFFQRRGPTSNLSFTVGEDLVDAVRNVDAANVLQSQSGGGFQINCDAEFIRKNAELMRSIAEIVRTSKTKTS